MNTNNLSHIAIIIDGNGRWATQRGLERMQGHVAGRIAFENMCAYLSDLNVQYFTVYGFSTENWSRPAEETSNLLAIFKSYLENCSEISKKSDYRIKIIGSQRGLPTQILEAMKLAEEETSQNTGLTVQIAFNYGGRDEIVRAAHSYARDIMQGNRSLEEANTNDFERYLDTYGVPSPDIIIRTGGEKRLSNFLLWQCAYSELFFVDKYWPDFELNDLLEIIEEYNHRDRRFGHIKP